MDTLKLIKPILFLSLEGCQRRSVTTGKL